MNAGLKEAIVTNTGVVSKSKVILFGGATGDTGKYIITGDTYALDLICNKWSKLEGKYADNQFHDSLFKMFFRLWNSTVAACRSRKLLS